MKQNILVLKRNFILTITGSDLLKSNFKNMQNSAEDCAKACVAVSECTHWTWFTEANAYSDMNRCKLKVC